MVLLAGINALLYRYCGQSDLRVGAMVANRNRPETERLIGLLANTVILRTEVSGGLTGRELLRRVRRTTLEAYVHQELPFEVLLEQLRSQHDLAHETPFQLLLVFHSRPVRPAQAGDLHIRPAPEESGAENKHEFTISTFDWIIEAEARPDGLALCLRYNVDLFEPEFIQRRARRAGSVSGTPGGLPQSAVVRRTVVRRSCLKMDTIVWVDPPASVALPAGEIHVWRVALAQAEEVVQRLTRVLSDDEQRRSDGFHYERDRCSFSVGRGVLRMLVGRYLGSRPCAVKFEYGRWGKPRLAGTLGKSGLRFNAAHSDGLFSAPSPWSRRSALTWSVSSPYRRCCKSPNWRFPRRSMPPSAPYRGGATEAFFNCWTRREAWLKARGAGMAGPRDPTAEHPVMGERRGGGDPQSQGGAEDRWSIRTFRPASEYVAALAVEGPPGPVQAWQWSSAAG